MSELARGRGKGGGSLTARNRFRGTDPGQVVGLSELQGHVLRTHSSVRVIRRMGAA